MKSEFFNPNSKPSYALMSTISGHAGYRVMHMYMYITVNFMLNKRKNKKAAGAKPQTPLEEL